ncbi:MAG: hypothetical protein G8345_02865 [Magnetococcales bacterium]|nr:DsrE family protein [Magnetococcales bacterium]NGZ25814.1 hypothetical protein [Magnetococcales bacterium]
MSRWMLAAVLALGCWSMPLSPLAWAGDGASRLDDTPYTPQKAVYHFNFSAPSQLEEGFRRVGNHVKTLEKHGDLAKSKLVVVINGNELHALARANQAVFPEIPATLAKLVQQGVVVRICGNAAQRRGYQVGDFYDLTTVVPAAVTEVTRLQNEGYAYIHLELSDALSRDKLKSLYPELAM